MKKIIIFIFSILWLSACNDDIDTETLATNETNNETSTLGFSENDVIKGRMRIKLKEEPSGQIAVRSTGGQISTGMRALDGSATVLGITRMERTFPYAGKYEKRTRKEGLHLWYDVWYSEKITATRAVGEVTTLEGIEQVSPVRKLRINGTSMPTELVASLMQNNISNGEFPWNDTDFNRQWNFYNPGTESWQSKQADIRIVDVWKQYNGNPNIIIAVTDEGIDMNHNDLQANIWTNPNEIADNGIDDDGNGFIDDVHGYNFAMGSSQIIPYKHGTHVAGIIGAINNNNKGVCGIAGGNGNPNSGVKLMCCQILDSRATETHSPAAIKYAADMGAVISQNSWGYTNFSEIDPADKEAIDYFIKYAGCDNDGNQLPDSPMKGGIVLFATNNHDTSNPSDATPADYEKVIGVAAIGPDYKKGTYSDYGTYIDICAPGGRDRVFDEKAIYSTVTGNRYDYLSGASMACPHVSGVAALIIEKHGVGKQGFTANQLEEILFTTAYDVDAYNPNYVGQLGSGCVNAAGALQAELPTPKAFILKTNPVTNGTLLFRVNSELAGNAVVTLYNSIGNKVLQQNIKTQRYISAVLNIQKLSAGYYTLQYECNGSSVKEKFVKY